MCSDLWFEQMWSIMLGREKRQGLPGSRIVRLSPHMLVEEEVDDECEYSPLPLSHLVKDHILWNNASSVRLDLPSAAKSLWKCPHRHAQRCFS